MGISSLVGAWSNVLAGQLDRVPTFLGATDDVLETVGTPSDEKAQTPYVLDDKRLKGLPLLAWALRLGRDWLTRSMHSRIIHLPAGYVSQLRLEAQEQLGYGSDSDNSPFLSDGDLILARLSHMMVSARSKKPILICNAFDMRGRFGNNTNSSKGSYLQNLVLFSCAFVPAAEVLSSSAFGQIALRIRQAVLEGTKETQVRSLMRIMRESRNSAGLPPFFGTSDSLLFVCSNWGKARFHEAADFGPAVVSIGGGGVDGGGSPTSDHGEKPGTAVASESSKTACLSGLKNE